MFTRPLIETLSLYTNTTEYRQLPLSIKLQLISFSTLLDVGKVDNQYVYDSLKELDSSILEDIKAIELESIRHNHLLEFIKYLKECGRTGPIIKVDSLSMLVEA